MNGQYATYVCIIFLYKLRFRNKRWLWCIWDTRICLFLTSVSGRPCWRVPIPNQKCCLVTPSIYQFIILKCEFSLAQGFIYIPSRPPALTVPLFHSPCSSHIAINTLVLCRVWQGTWGAGTCCTVNCVLFAVELWSSVCVLLFLIQRVSCNVNSLFTIIQTPKITVFSNL